MSAAVELFGDSLKLSNVKMLFPGDKLLRAHSFQLSSSFGVMKEMFAIEPEKTVVDMLGCPAQVTREGVAGLMAIAYGDVLLPGASEAAKATPMYLMEAAADYLHVSAGLTDALFMLKRCHCCMKGKELKLRNMCACCWQKSGDQIANDDRPITYDAALGLVTGNSRELSPDDNVKALCAAIRATPPGHKKCVNFARLVAENLPNHYRLTTEQSRNIQRALHQGGIGQANGGWCMYTEIGVHNLMASPGEYVPNEHSKAIHCYLGFQDTKQQSARVAANYSTGHVPHCQMEERVISIYAGLTGLRCSCARP